MNALVQQESRAIAQTGGRMAVADVIAHVTTVQEVQRAVMKPEVHYGKIPGAGDKPTLLKPGAELLCMTFRVADEYHVEDLSTADSIRYRVTCVGKHQLTGVTLGSGLGEASSNEEKYKWRRAVCDEEWDETPANLRRKKYAKAKGGGHYVQKQVRTEPADIANTVLKMANKRAKIAMTLNVTAASDMFSQDLEDMDEALRDHLARRGEETQDQPEQGNQPAGLPTWPDDAFEKQFDKFKGALGKGRTVDDVIAWAETKGKLTDAQKKRIRDAAPAQASGTAPDKNVTDVQPKVTFASVAAQINAAKDHEQLAAAAAFISAVTDEGHRKELTALYEQRCDEIPLLRNASCNSTTSPRAARSGTPTAPTPATPATRRPFSAAPAT